MEGQVRGVLLERQVADLVELCGCPRSRRPVACTDHLGWSTTYVMRVGPVSEKTVADSMRRQGLMARLIKRRNGLTKQDKTAPKLPHLLKRDFTARRTLGGSGT